MTIKFNIVGKSCKDIADALDGFFGLRFKETEENGEKIYKGGAITIHQDGHITLPKVNHTEAIVHLLVTKVLSNGITCEEVNFKEVQE